MYITDVTDVNPYFAIYIYVNPYFALCLYIYIYAILYAYSSLMSTVFHLKNNGTSRDPTSSIFPPKNQNWGWIHWNSETPRSESVPKHLASSRGLLCLRSCGGFVMIIHWWRIWFNGKKLKAKKKGYCFLIMKMISEYDSFIDASAKTKNFFLADWTSIADSQAHLSTISQWFISLIHGIENQVEAAVSNSAGALPTQSIQEYYASCPDFSWWNHHFWCLIPS